MLQRLLVLAFLLLVLAAGTSTTAGASAAGERPNVSWLVRAGKNFQRAGEYTVRLLNTRFEDAIRAYGAPSSCRVVGSNNHAIAVWADRGIWIDLWTYGGFPEGENGCISPDLIYVSDIRLTDARWTTSLGLHVGDRTTKLRRLYSKAPYVDGQHGWGRNQYYLVQRHGRCFYEACTPYELRHGVDFPQLIAQVKKGRVVAFWLPVGGQGE
jgi:hypothetical protein